MTVAFRGILVLFCLLFSALICIVLLRNPPGSNSWIGVLLLLAAQFVIAVLSGWFDRDDGQQRKAAAARKAIAARGGYTDPARNKVVSLQQLERD
ncbi:hypothetical protein [Pseudomonas sp. UMAB-40]|uniref:hypothetical protein n=1 Tax=Pseudomonas sp. UMAB-40 TaxID=1365407 RepID=UPI001C5A1422|nr:hypothetical protein [Pseudomonas sp. UMAB-40]